MSISNKDLTTSGLWPFIKRILYPYRYYLSFMLFNGLVWGLYLSLSPYLLKMIIDNLAQYKSADKIYLPAIGYVVLYLFTALNFRILDWIKYKILPPIKRSITLNMFNYIKLHSHTFFQNHFAGSMSNKINDMVTNIEALLLTCDEFLTVIGSFIIALFIMGTVNTTFSIALLVWFITFFALSFSLSKKIHLLSIETSEAYSTYAGTLVDILTNMSSVRLFSRLNFESHNLYDSVTNLVNKDQRMLKYSIKMRLVLDATLVALLAFMIYSLISFYEQSLVTIGDFALILSLTIAIFEMMWNTANKIVTIYRVVGKCHQAYTLIQTPHEITDIKNATQLKVSSGLIKFENVTFSYPNTPTIFKNLQLRIEPGSKVGLVGYSGSGKSTFINLLLRLYEIHEGAISIDGIDISSVTQDSLRESISLIPQDITLFHRSLKDNIHYGNIHASDEEIILASKKAHCHEFIITLKDGYDTFVGERGIKLSGGQRQRIAIARAFLENAPILILDEATSSLDSVTEKYIQESLHIAIQNRTTIIIAHRLSTLLEMDRILVFKDGEIIEDGSHVELLKLDGHYANMWAMQSNGFLPNIEVQDN